MEKNKGLWLLAIYFFLSVYLLPMFSHETSADELTRWATAAALVERGSFEISRTKNLTGENLETIRFEDEIYSAQTPGVALLAAPVYALTRIFIGAPDASNVRVSWFVMRFFLASLPLLLLGFWLYGRDSDELSLAVLLFASPLFIYSLLFYSHVIAGVALYFAFRLIYDTERIFLRNCFFAGLICGFAVVCELSAFVGAAVFGAGMLFTGRRERNGRQNIIFFALGILPFVIFLPVYSYAVLGSPFALFQTPEIGFPTLSNLYLLLGSPAHGLFFYAPILILAVVALFTSKERRTLRHRVKTAAILISVIALCGRSTADGGWAFGARYLIFILPLLLDSFFDGEIYEYSNLWQGFLFGVSFLLCTFPALTLPLTPPEFRFPHNDFWFALVWQNNFFAPNLANAFGFSSGFWTITPVIIALLAAFFIVWRSARRPNRFLIGAACGLLAVGVYMLLPNLNSEKKSVRRAEIIERLKE